MMIMLCCFLTEPSRINAETQRNAEERRGEELLLSHFSASLRALCVSALKPLRLWLQLGHTLAPNASGAGTASRLGLGVQQLEAAAGGKGLGAVRELTEKPLEQLAATLGIM